jgi:hypothetical protein
MRAFMSISSARLNSCSIEAIPCASSERHLRAIASEARGRVRQLLPAGTILCLPTTPFSPPRGGLPKGAHYESSV